MTLFLRDVVAEVSRMLRTENIPYSVQDLLLIAAGATSDLTNLKPVLIKRFWLNSKMHKQRYALPPEVRQVLSVWYKPANASFVVNTQTNPKRFVVVGTPEWAGWDEKGTLVWYIKSGGLSSPKPYKVKFQTSPFNTTAGSAGSALMEDLDNLWRGRTPRDGEGVPYRLRCAALNMADDFERSIGAFNADQIIDYFPLYVDPEFNMSYAPTYDFYNYRGTIVEEDKGWIELEPVGATEAFFPSNALTDSPVLENQRCYGVFGNQLVIQYPIEKHGYKNIMVEAVCHFALDRLCCNLDTDTGLNPRYLRLLVVMTLRRALEATLGQAAIDWITQLLKEEQQLLQLIPSEIEYLNQVGYGASILPYSANKYKPSTENHEEWDFQRLGYWSGVFRRKSYALQNAINVPVETLYMPAIVEFTENRKQDTIVGVKKITPFFDELFVLLNITIPENEIVRIRVPQKYSAMFPTNTSILVGSTNIPVVANINLEEERNMRLW